MDLMEFSPEQETFLRQLHIKPFTARGVSASAVRNLHQRGVIEKVRPEAWRGEWRLSDRTLREGLGRK
jgi:hypothetical protein